MSNIGCNLFGNTRAAAYWAFSQLQKEGIKGVLIGTAGLAAHGLISDPPDVDILVEKAPSFGEPLLKFTEEYKDGVNADTVSRIQRFYNAKSPVDVNYVIVTEARLPFFPPDEKVVWINNMPVAPVKLIVNLKKQAHRPKDIEFFRLNPHVELAASLED